MARQSILCAAMTTLLSLGPLAQATDLSGTQASQRFCGGAAVQGDPTDLANQVGDQTLEYMLTQPANIVTCSKGYLLEKCGDHESANLIFDRCIAAGYVGAMIWKALMIQDGHGNGEDISHAAELMRRAASSDNPAYAPLGMVHYATMLLQGRGVAKDEATAMAWFRRAAAAGNQDAHDFLRDGYHTADRDQNGMGSGTPTAAALAQGRFIEESSGAGIDLAAYPPAGPFDAWSPITKVQAPAPRSSARSVLPATLRRLGSGPAGLSEKMPSASMPASPSTLEPPPVIEVTGQHLAARPGESPVAGASALPLTLGVLALAFLSGLGLPLHWGRRCRFPDWSC